MENKSLFYQEYKNLMVGVRSHEAHVNGKVLNGKGMLNLESARFEFIQSNPRGPRNKQVLKTKHMSLTDRGAGEFYCTVRFNPATVTKEALAKELRQVWNLANKMLF